MSRIKINYWVIYSLILFVPILLFSLLSFAAFPAADDINDMVRLHENNASGIFNIINIAVSSAFSGRSNGTFSHYILRGLSPAFISFTLNRIILFFSFWLFSFSIYRFISCVSKYFLNLKKSTVAAIAFTLIFVSVNNIISPAQSFFWYSGVVNYTFVFSCILFLICNCMDFFYKYKIKPVEFWLKHALSVLFIFIIGGSQTAGGIFALGVLFFACAVYTIIALQNKFETRKLFIYFYFILLAIFLLLNIQGSFARREMFDTAMSIRSAPVHAMLAAARDLFRWHHGVTIFLLIIIFPALAASIRNSRKINFAHPIIATLIAGVLFVAMYLPAFFGMGARGPERLVDFYLIISNILIFAWFCYIAGFFVSQNLIPEKIEKFRFIILICAGILFLSFGTHHINNFARGNFSTAARQIMHGDIARHNFILNSRELILNDSRVSEMQIAVEFAPFPFYRLTVYDREVMDFYYDTAHWRSMARVRLNGVQSLRRTNDLATQIFRAIPTPAHGEKDLIRNEFSFNNLPVINLPLSHYINEGIFVRDNLMDFSGRLPSQEKGALPHSDVKMTLTSPNGGEKLFFPVFPLTLDIYDRVRREYIRENYFTLSIDFSTFTDGIYSVGIAKKGVRGGVIVWENSHQGELAIHGAAAFFHPHPQENTARVPVLMYHHLTAHPVNDWQVTPAAFAEQMRTLRNFGFNPVTSAQLVNFVNYNYSLPPHPVMITFDDGYLSVYEYAFPILMRYGMAATSFIIGHAVGTDTYKDTNHPTTPKFDFDHARRMAGVMDIQSHSYDMHQVAWLETAPARVFMLPFENESDAAFAQAVAHDHYLISNLVRAELGTEIIALSFPHGRYSNLTLEALREAGILITFGSNFGTNILTRNAANSLQALNRKNINNEICAQRLLELLR